MDDINHLNTHQSTNEEFEVISAKKKVTEKNKLSKSLKPNVTIKPPVKEEKTEIQTMETKKITQKTKKSPVDLTQNISEVEKSPADLTPNANEAKKTPSISEVIEPKVRPFVSNDEKKLLKNEDVLRQGKDFQPTYAKNIPVNNSNHSKHDKTANTMSLTELEEKSLVDLRNLAKDLRLEGADNYRKGELVLRILEQQVKLGGNIFASGFLEIVNDGTHGILRSKTMLPGENDVYISSSQIKRLNLRKGDFISGQARPAKEGERYLSLLKVEAINGVDPEKAISRPTFERQTPIYPNEQLILETTKEVLSTRIIDLLSPIGKGQRAMIVAPPKTGKTIMLKEIAQGVRKNSPQIHLMIVLIGERPEEVTDIERAIGGAEVMAANFDDSPQDQTKVAEMALERAKRLVEMGSDVVMLMDSITRLARAYNTVLPASGRTLSGGMDPVALYPSKKFFGAARNFENGGSLTIIATALVETGSRMDDMVFEEFKGTGNMELKLSRDLSNRKVYPAIDVESSGTRNEELLLSKEVLAESWRIRRMLSLLGDNEASEMLIQRLRKTKDNDEFLRTLAEG